MFDKQKLYEAAKKCAEWEIGNQVNNREDANRGRFIRCYCQDNSYLNYTGNWQTGSALMSLLAMYQRTNDPKYLESAELAGSYIMSLQILDTRTPRYYGAIRELTPQSIEFAPRDATTAAWALVWLYNVTKKEEYLNRAILFGEFHLKYCMHEGWPLYACYMDRDLGNFYARGSFQSGTGLFYHDLFMASDDPRYIEFGMRPIADNYLKYFVKENGAIVLERDIFTWTEKEESIQPGVTPDMHMYNDDFGAAMLQTASDIFHDEKYRKAAFTYAQWLAEYQQDEDGGFAGGVHPSAVPTALNYFYDLGNYYNDKKLLKACEKTLNKLLSMQLEDTGNSQLDGGFRGKNESADQTGKGLCVNNRTTSYALIALLKLESKLENIWLGRYNKHFVDPLKTGTYILK